MADGPPRIFDRHAVVLHRARADRLCGDRFLLHEAEEGIFDRLGCINRRFDRRLLVGSLPVSQTVLDLASGPWTRANLGENETLGVDEQSFDLVISLLEMHLVNDLPGLLVQIRRALRPDGVLIAALFGGETLTELRDVLTAAEIETTGGVSPRVAPFADVRDLGGLLQRAGFALPVTDVERTVVRYRSFSGLLRDLRAHGETNALASRRRKPFSHGMLAATVSQYAARHADPDGRLRATFDIVYLTGWAPHDSQQKPLAPGSAMTSLAKALGTSEFRVSDPRTGS